MYLGLPFTKNSENWIMNSNGNGVVIICIAVLLASQVKTEQSTNEPGKCITFIAFGNLFLPSNLMLK